GDVEGHVRKFRVEGARHREGVARAVQKIGIAERDVSRAGRHELADVRLDRLGGDDEEPPAVHWWDRAVAAEVLAPAARLDVAGELELTVALELRVALQLRQRRAAGDGHVG